MSDKRIPLVILGHEIGTASGWDQVADTILFFYDVQVTADLNLSGPFDIAFDHMLGVIEIYNEDGTEVLATYDAIKFFETFQFDRYEQP